MSVIQFFIFVFCSHTPPFAETIPPAGNPRISISAVPSDIRNSAVNTFRWNQQTNLKAHYFISNQYWKSNYELVKEMLSQSEVYVFEADKMIQGFVGLNDKYIEGIFVSDTCGWIVLKKMWHL